MKKAIAILFVLLAIPIVTLIVIMPTIRDEFIPIVFEWDDDLEFQLFVRSEDAEFSDDSNSRIEQILIEDQHAIYTNQYDGYHPDGSLIADERYGFDLTDAELAELMQVIEDYELDQNIDEQQEITSGRAVFIVLKMQHEGTRYESIIQAMTDMWFAPEGEPDSNLENDIYREGAQELIDVIKGAYES